MSPPATVEIPPDVHELLFEYRLQREAARWIVATKQNSVAPIDRLCAELNSLRSKVERCRDEWMRAIHIYELHAEPSEVRAEELSQELLAPLSKLLEHHPPIWTPCDDDGALIESWKRLWVHSLIMTYAQLDCCPSIEQLVRDATRLSAIAVALSEAERIAQNYFRRMLEHAPSPTEWLLAEWRECFPSLSRRALARWISALGIEPGTPESIEDRLRKAEGRRGR